VYNINKNPRDSATGKVAANTGRVMLENGKFDKVLY